MLVFFSVAFACFAAFAICARFANVLSMRTDPSTVAELGFTQIQQERGPTGLRRVVSDPNLIRQAFTCLGHSVAFQRKHQQFFNGYAIRIKLKGAVSFSNRYVFVYRRDHRGREVTIAIANVRRSAGGLADAGKYSTPEFHDWLATAIDPLFGRNELGVPQNLRH